MFRDKPDVWFNAGQMLFGLLYALASLILTWGVVSIKRLQTLILRKRDHEIPLELSHKTDIEINVVLDRALRKFGAQRAYLSQFHNGEQFAAGSDIIKQSRTHERVRLGVSYEAAKYQSVLITSMPEEIKLVLEDGPGWSLVESLPDSKFRWHCEQAGVSAVARAQVRCNGQPAGFIGLDFDATSPSRPEKVSELCDLGRQIGQIMASCIGQERDAKAPARIIRRSTSTMRIPSAAHAALAGASHDHR